MSGTRVADGPAPVRSAQLRVLAVVLPVYVVFLVVYVLAPEDSDYAVSLTAETAKPVYLSVLIGIAAALRGSALSSGGAAVRRPVTALLGAIWPLLAFAVVAQLAAVGGVALYHGAGIAVGLLAVSVVALIAQVVLAAWLGLILSGGPATFALVGIWVVWLLLPGWLGLPVVTQLNGQFAGCCAGDETWYRPAAVASAVVAVGLLAGVLAAVHQAAHTARSVALAVTVPVVVASVTALLLPDATRSATARPRPDDTRCFDGDVRICLRPEHVDALAEVGVAVSELERGWAPYGVRMPGTISEAGGPGRVRFQWGPEHDADLVRYTLALNLVPTPDGCYREPLPPEHDRPLVAAVDHVTAWLLFTSGTPRWSADESVEPVLTDRANLDEVFDVLDRPDPDQAAWYAKELATIESCGGRDG
ncbi:DUF7224 domain-containing protein [Cryptosporangium arvum]|uniref:DUF7224 domain-containing protein n=1 Tax=Cryptosporangium arvum TaxID=80871 RepID=UPI0004AF51B8|nr:hypothetical protein [Cryptosporangium arvum]